MTAWWSCQRMTTSCPGRWSAGSWVMPTILPASWSTQTWAMEAFWSAPHGSGRSWTGSNPCWTASDRQQFLDKSSPSVPSEGDLCCSTRLHCHQFFWTKLSSCWTACDRQHFIDKTRPWVPSAVDLSCFMRLHCQQSWTPSSPC